MGSNHQDLRCVLVHAADHALVDSIARLIVGAVDRREALGLVPPLSVADYRGYLAGLLADAERGDAGLAAVLLEDGRLAGTAQWRRSPYPTRRVLADLDRVTVDPGLRGAGVGRAAVNEIMADAAAHGVEVLALEARGNNHGAIALYESLDFKRTGLLPNVVAEGDARHDMVLMCRELSRPPAARLLGSIPAGAGASVTSAADRGPGWSRTERLLLCVPAVSDAADYFALHSDPATNAHNPAGPQTDPSAGAAALALWHRHWRESGYGYWTVRLADTGEVIGFGGVRPPAPPEDFANLCYLIRPADRGNGYATELGRAALALAARVAPGVSVNALIRPANEPSIRVAGRIGLHADGEVDRELGRYLRFSVVPR
jgi:RimJ/RimL family protein N-acetyltransferase